MRATVEVTAEHIAAADRWREKMLRGGCEAGEAYSEHCPIAQALMGAYSAKRAEAGHMWIVVEGDFGRLRATTPIRMIGFMGEWDSKSNPHPRTFEIEWE